MLKGVKCCYALVVNNAAYVRNALVWCTQGIYSIYDYLEQIYFDAAGLLDGHPEPEEAKQKDHSIIEWYHVAEYKEQPHSKSLAKVAPSTKRIEIWSQNRKRSFDMRENL